VVILATLAPRAFAQPVTRCAACHFANMSNVPAPEHLGEWQQSAHARQQVGCDKCHGGDPWTYLPTEAHRGVLRSSSLDSPVHAANLVGTCGRCHRANADAFNRSLHQSLVQAEERRAPNCTTCHGAMRAQVPSPIALEQRCAGCHPAGSPRADYPAAMRTGIESLNALRARAQALEDVVAQVADRTRRVELLVALYNVRASIKEAVARVHAFDAQAVNEQIAETKRQLDALGLDTAATDTGR
jgi:cytochrome c7-like protein/cytochrome c554/c'-like protein